MLGNPQFELSLTELAEQLHIPYASAHREIERAEASGLVRSRRVGNTRLVQAETASPYFDALSELLTRAFGVPAVLGTALADVGGVTEAFVFGSWAAQYLGQKGERAVHDIDVLVLGTPDRDVLYERIEPLQDRLGRPVQVTIRDADWLKTGNGSFHSNVTARPLVRVPLSGGTSLS